MFRVKGFSLKFSGYLPVVFFVQDIVLAGAFIVVGTFDLNQFFKLMFNFFHEIGSGVHEEDGASAGEVLFVLAGDQFFDPYPSSVQDIHDPVEN